MVLRGEEEGLHDLRVSLRRTEATAAALGEKKIEKRSRAIVQSLSPLRQLEVDLGMLARLKDLGRIPGNVGAGLEARWHEEHADGLDRAVRTARGDRLRRLEKKVRRAAGSFPDDALTRLERGRRRVDRRLALPAENATDRALHRYRIAVKRARYLDEDLAACGVPGLETRIAREKDLQDALGHWNDVHLFRERLKETRSISEETGAVGLAADLDPVIAALEGALASARRNAFAVAGRFARVLPFLERSA